MAGKKSACPVCGGKYADAYVAAHMRKAHNIYGGRRGYKAEANDKPVVKGQAVEVFNPPAPKRSKLPFPEVKLQMLPLAVFKDQEGRTWIAEQVNL